MGFEGGALFGQKNQNQTKTFIDMNFAKVEFLAKASTQKCLTVCPVSL